MKANLLTFLKGGIALALHNTKICQIVQYDTFKASWKTVIVA